MLNCIFCCICLKPLTHAAIIYEELGLNAGLHQLALLPFMSRQETDFLQEASQYTCPTHCHTCFCFCPSVYFRAPLKDCETDCKTLDKHCETHRVCVRVCVTRATKTYYVTQSELVNLAVTIIRHGYTQWMQRHKPCAKRHNGLEKKLFNSNIRINR